MFAATTPVSGKAVHFYVHGANWELCDALEGAEKGEQSGYVSESLAGKGKFEGKGHFLPYDFLCLLFKEAAVNIDAVRFFLCMGLVPLLHDEPCSDSAPFRLKNLKHQRGQWLFLGWCSGTTLKKEKRK